MGRTDNGSASARSLSAIESLAKHHNRMGHAEKTHRASLNIQAAHHFQWKKQLHL